MTDKIGVKEFVSERLGVDWLIPTLWCGLDLPERCPWTPPFVVKSRHGCAQTIVVDVDTDWNEVRRRARAWVTKPYGGWLDEWGYRDVPRGIVVEPYIGAGATLPIDYKVYVFGGRAAFVQVHLGRGGHAHRWIVHDREWRRYGTGRDRPARPSALSAMLAAAEKLAHGFDFVRVDCYQPGDRPLFGEMSFYPGSGLDPFDPPELDPIMGALWLAARPMWLPSAVDPIMDRLEAAPV